ncbi:MAG: hypothetical protein U1E83_09280 [Methylotetracoccus sp.]
MSAGPPLFVAGTSRCALLLSSLRQIGEDDWQRSYVDERSGIVWIRFRLWDYHGSGPDCLRRGNPDLKQIIETIERSRDVAEIAAAAHFLANELPGRQENYEPLLRAMERTEAKPWSVAEALNVATAIVWSGIDIPFNHRDPNGRSVAEIYADFEHFRQLATRAASLKQRAEALLGRPIERDIRIFD